MNKKSSIWILSSLISFASVAVVLAHFHGVLPFINTDKQNESITASDDHSGHGPLHTCPMHPEIIRETEGSCPICGMDLVPMPEERSGTKSSSTKEIGLSDKVKIEAEEANPIAFEGMPPLGTKAHCTVMDNDFVVSESTLSSEYKGKTYVFCCPGCKPQFDEDPEKFIAVKASYLNITIDPRVVQNMGIRIGNVTKGPIYKNIRTVGEIVVPENEISVVNLRFSGWIEKIFANETGKRVKKGQPLFRIYSPQLVTAQEEYLLSVKAEGLSSSLSKSSARRLELLGISKSHLKRIAKRGHISKFITINAPRAGFIFHKTAVEGAFAKAGTNLYRIGELDKIWVNAEIYEFDAAWVKLGQKATMELNFISGKIFEGTVDYIYPTLNPKSRTLTVRLEYENPGLDLKPGMLAIIRIRTQNADDVITVPTEAILHSGERRLVFVSQELGQYEPREITTGLVADNRQTEVLDGLDEGEQVVISGQFLLDSESKLQEAVQKLIADRLQVNKSGGVGDTYWTCGMCPQVVNDGPGSCPICGMDLVEKSK